MITCKFDFKPNEFEKSLVNQLMDDIEKRLSRGGVQGVTVKMDKNHQLSFEGPEEEISKVNSILDS